MTELNLSAEAGGIRIPDRAPPSIDSGFARTMPPPTLHHRRQQMSVEDLDRSLNAYAAQIAGASNEHGMDAAAMPSSPFGPRLSELGVGPLTLNTLTNRLRADRSSSAPGGAALPPGFVLGQNISNRMATAIQKQPLPKADKPKDEVEPKFPGKDGDVGDCVEWIKFYADLKAKFPGLDGSFDDYKKYARDLLIEQGVDYAITQINELAQEFLQSILGGDANAAMADAMNTAVGGGFFEGILGQISEKYEKIKGILTDPDKLFEFALEKGLPKLADLGLDKLFDMWKLDDSSPLSAQLAKIAAEKIVREIVDQLLEGVKSLDDLAKNFENLQENLTKKIDEFFNGTPGKATRPAVRVGDKDDKVDVVASGLATVIVEGMPIARVLDSLTPSGKVIVEGSSSVLSGKLPTARVTSKTAVPSTMATSAAKVFIGDPSVVVKPPQAQPQKPSGQYHDDNSSNSEKKPHTKLEKLRTEKLPNGLEVDVCFGDGTGGYYSHSESMNGGRPTIVLDRQQIKVYEEARLANEMQSAHDDARDGYMDGKLQDESGKILSYLEAEIRSDQASQAVMDGSWQGRIAQSIENIAGEPGYQDRIEVLEKANALIKNGDLDGAKKLADENPVHRNYIDKAIESQRNECPLIVDGVTQIYIGGECG